MIRFKLGEMIEKKQFADGRRITVSEIAAATGLNRMTLSKILNQKGSLFLTRPALGAYVATREELLGRANDLFAWIAGGKLDVRIDQRYALRDAAAAVGVSEAAIRNEIRAGRLEARKLGRAVLVDARELRRFVENLPPAA